MDRKKTSSRYINGGSRLACTVPSEEPLLAPLPQGPFAATAASASAAAAPKVRT